MMFTDKGKEMSEGIDKEVDGVPVTPLLNEEGAAEVYVPPAPKKAKRAKKPAPNKEVQKETISEVKEEAPLDPPKEEEKYIVAPKKQGEGSVALQNVMLVVGNEVAVLAAQASITNGQWNISMAQGDGFLSTRVLKPISEGRAPDPRYKANSLELYVLGDVKKRFTGLSLNEFQATPLLNGRMVITKASGKYKGISNSPVCPYPLAKTLVEQHKVIPVPSTPGMVVPPNQSDNDLIDRPETKGVLLF